MKQTVELSTGTTEYMLSTKDNPFDPFTQFDQWYQYDFEKGHHSCEVLGRFANCSDDLSIRENNAEIAEAIDRIIANDAEKKFIKVKRNDDKYLAKD